MAERIILHCDLNNFFASVECLGKDELKGKPVAVAGSVEKRHGIILAKNEVAKKFGVKTAEAIWQAQLKCPDLVLLSPHYELYNSYSQTVRQIYERYTDIIEPFGIDECWLDVTGSTFLFGSGEQIADKIRKAVKAETGLTISVGVSFNKVFAKLGSDLKKPDAVTVISRDNFKEIVWPLDVGELIGVGKATKQSLCRIGLFTVGDVAKANPDTLKLVLGKAGESLWKFTNGLDNSPVISSEFAPPPKSIGRSTTPPENLCTHEDIMTVLIKLCDRVSASLRQNHALAGVVQVHIRDTKLNITEHQKKLDEPIRLTELLFRTGVELINEIWDKETPLRSIGIRATQLVPQNESFQLSLGCDYDRLERLEKLECVIGDTRERYGKDAIVRCRQLSGETIGIYSSFGKIVI
ncbi:MAG: DNA polymerase IV [Clostridia bacterium]|nr:DNA polymerase IV [Clostridia bacterium]